MTDSRKKSRCFRRNPPVQPYYHQKNAWCDSMQYNRWFKEVFLPNIRQWTSEPVALLLDGFSGHDIGTVDPHDQVTVFKFPPNITIVFSP